MGLGTITQYSNLAKAVIHNSAGQTRIKLTNNVTGATANDGFDIIQEHNNDVHILNMKTGVRMRIDSLAIWAWGIY